MSPDLFPRERVGSGRNTSFPAPHEHNPCFIVQAMEAWAWGGEQATRTLAIYDSQKNKQWVNFRMLLIIMHIASLKL